MAITWNQLSDPNFTAGNNLLLQGRGMWDKAIQQFGTTANNFAAGVEKQNTNKLMDALYAAKDPTQFQSQDFQNNLQALKAQYGQDYDQEKFRTAMDSRLGKLQTDGLNAIKFQDAEDGVANRNLLTQYYDARRTGDDKTASLLAQQLHGGLRPEDYLAGNGVYKDQFGLNMQTNEYNLNKLKADRDYELGKGNLQLDQDKFNAELEANSGSGGGIALDAAGNQVQVGGSTGGGAGMVMPSHVRDAVFAGESKGDYDALLGFSNRAGGKFANTKLTDMTVNDAIKFSDPKGEYAQFSKQHTKGKVATPMGAYQVVGTTLKTAMQGLGLKGDEKMTPELQDRIGDYIYQTQGTGAWQGYKGKKMGGGGYKPRKATAQASAPSKPLITSEAQANDLKAVHTAANTERTAKIDRASSHLMAFNRPDDDSIKDVKNLTEWENKNSHWYSGRTESLLEGLRSNKQFNSLPPLQQVKFAQAAMESELDHNQPYRGVFGTSWGRKRNVPKWAEEYAISQFKARDTLAQQKADVATKQSLLNYNVAAMLESRKQAKKKVNY